MKYLVATVLILTAGIMYGQDAGMEIEVDNAIITGGGGALKLQSESGKKSSISTLLIDATDIQSYDADSSWYCGTLYVQDQGGSIQFLREGRGKATFNGNVVFGDSIKIGGAIQTTASSEIAFGTIRSAGSISSGSGNYTVSWSGTRYEIEIEDEEYYFLDYTTLITPNTSSVYSYYTTSATDKLIVYLRDIDGNSTQGNFQFVTHKNVPTKGTFDTDCDSEGEEQILFAKHKTNLRK